jgi:Arc/MetJ-type ribon-helix-helix transcriptional regulator
MENISALPSGKDVKEIDRLVEKGIFLNRHEAIKTAIRVLIQLRSEMENTIKGLSAVNSYLMDNFGDLPFADEPSIEEHKGLKVFKFPIKTMYKNKDYLLGHIFVDANSFEIIKEMSDSKEKLIDAAKKIVEHDDQGSLL